MAEKNKSFQDLVVWQKSHQLAQEVFRITKKFPRNEKDGLSKIMRNTAISVPANLAHGFRRHSRKDKMEYYGLSRSYLEELHYYFILSRDLGFTKEYETLFTLIDEVGRMLTRLIISVKTRGRSAPRNSSSGDIMED